MIDVAVRDEKGVRSPQAVPTAEEFEALLARVEKLENVKNVPPGQNDKK